jgi:hypothetical protein
MSQHFLPLSRESRLLGLQEIDRLLELTLARDSKGLSRTEYMVSHGGVNQSLTTQLTKATRGDYPGDFKRETIVKLAQMILVPGSKQYFGDTPKLLARFVMIYEGWIDGVPLHLRGQCSEPDYDTMPTEELEDRRSQIDRILESRSIDLEVLVPVNVVVNSMLLVMEERLKMTRSQLAERTIGSKLYAELLAGTQLVTEGDVQSLADFCELDASLIVGLHQSCIARNRKNQPSDILKPIFKDVPDVLTRTDDQGLTI